MKRGTEVEITTQFSQYHEGTIVKVMGDGLYLVKTKDASQIICMESELKERQKVHNYTPKHKRANDVGHLN